MLCVRLSKGQDTERELAMEASQQEEEKDDENQPYEGQDSKNGQEEEISFLYQ